MHTYPAHFQAEPEGGFTVTFRDVPEAITYGQTLEQAHEMAADALSVALEFYAERDESAPQPSAAQKGEQLISAKALETTPA